MLSMSVLVHQQHGTVTASAGTASVNVVANNSICHQIFLKPATGTTTYDITLTDIYSNVVYRREDVRGELNDLEPGILTYGNWTLTIENSSADEEFTYLLVFRES